VINKVHQGRPHVVDRINDGGIAIVLNTTESRRAIRDSYTLRRAALEHKIPYYTTVAGARAVVQAMTAPAARDLAVAPLQSYYRMPVSPYLKRRTGASAPVRSM
jgi:carbamoyl-phosphate synthase large subunit